MNLGEERRKQMKLNKLITTLLALVSASVAAKADDWKQWSFVVSPVYSVAISDFKFTDVRYGGGLRGELFVLDNLSLEAQGVTYDVHNSTVDEASVSLNYYIPVKQTPFSLVASLGTLKGFEQNENWNYKGGAAVVAEVTKTLSARVGGYFVDDFQNNTELRFEAGVGYKF